MKRFSLSGFQLKYIALITMVFDHIQYFFEYTGKIPIWFTMIGRLAAPLFLFAVIEGFVHTHNRKKYFLRIYALAILMGLIQFGFYNFSATCSPRLISRLTSVKSSCPGKDLLKCSIVRSEEHTSELQSH